jgi:hydroxypyruvate isomerase
MTQFAANLTTLYTELPFLDRFAAAAGDGFRGVEFLFPYDYAPDVVANRLAGAGLELVLFNLPPGDWDGGERGLAALPGREEEFERALTTGLAYARALGCRRLHAMAGIPAAGDDPAKCLDVFVRNLRTACERAAEADVTLLVEPINTRDMPGYFLNRQDEAHTVREAVGAHNLKVQMDLYHCQVMEGDLATRIRRHVDHVGHIQVAGVPDRNEPSTGEVNYPYIFDLLDTISYEGWIGCEYRPRAGTSKGLAWMPRT